MKRGKDEEKSMGPMFPRLHVNDTEKGGPRAPPRNKMALYEQLSIPSQRFNNGDLSLNPNNYASLVPPLPSRQGSGQERGVDFSLHLPPSTHQPHGHYFDLSTPRVQHDQKKQDEEDFRVPIFVHSGMGQDQTNNKFGERLSPFTPSISVYPMKFPNTGEKVRKQTSHSEENSNEVMASRDQPVKSASNLPAREANVGLMKHPGASLNHEHKDKRSCDFSRLENTDTILQQQFRDRSQPDNVARDHGVSSEAMKGVENGNSLVSRRELNPEEHISTRDRINYSGNCQDKTYGSLQMGTILEIDDVSEASMVDSESGLDLSPDDVVGMIGQKHFLKARKAIVNQQKVFAVQVFELHRLIKVQRSIAGSPHILLEENAYLAKPLKPTPAKNLPLDYVVKPPPQIIKQKHESEKPNHTMDHSEIVSSGQPSNYGPFSENPPPKTASTDTPRAPWSFPQSPGHQWLIPVMSPSEGLIYKPYSGPGFMDPVSGGYGPPSSTQVAGNFFNPSYGVPNFGHGYFPPYGMPALNNFTGLGSQGHYRQFSGEGGPNFNVQNQSSRNCPSPRSRAISSSVKVRVSIDSKLQGSTVSSSSERVQVVEARHSTKERDALSLFPSSSAVVHARVIKVVPHNARSATESAARIFRCIQEERNQCDSG